VHMQGEPFDHAGRAALRRPWRRGRRVLAGRGAGGDSRRVARAKIWLDRGSASAKHMTDTIRRLLAGLDRIGALGFPVLLGVSSKSFISALDGGPPRPDERTGRSIAGALVGAAGRVSGRAGPRDVGARNGCKALAVWRAIPEPDPVRQAGAAPQAP